MARFAALTGLLLVVLAGCGVSARPYDRDATAACLSSNSTVESVSTLKANLDFIAQAAGGGGIYVLFTGGPEAYLSFERTSTDVSRAYTNYELTASADVEAIGVALQKKANVVIAFSKAPTRAQARAVADCLRR